MIPHNTLKQGIIYHDLITSERERRIMSTLTITLPEERMRELQHIASRLGSSPEKLVEASINELLKQAEPNVHRAIAYVLKKNQELYKRLA